MLRRLILVTILMVLSSGSVYAEWLLVDKNDVSSIYVEPTTIRWNGNVVKWWELHDLKNVHDASGVEYLSVKVQSEHDCAEDLSRVLALMKFSGNMGTGHAVFRSDPGVRTEWHPVEPDSIGHTLWKLACTSKQ